MSVAGHGVLAGGKGAEKVDGSLWGWPRVLDTEVESVHGGQWEIIGLPETAEKEPGRPLKDGLCRGGRPAGCAVQLSAGHIGRSWFFRSLFQGKDSGSQRILWLQKQKQRYASLGTEHVRIQCGPVENHCSFHYDLLQNLTSSQPSTPDSKPPSRSRLLPRCLWARPPYDTRKTVLLTSHSAPS